MTGLKNDNGPVFAGANASSAPLDDLYREHGSWLRRLLARRLSAQAFDVEDLVQDTYLRVARQPPQGIAHPRAFLATTAMNLFRDGRRRIAVRAAHVEESAANQSVVAPFASLTEQEASVVLEQILSQMPATYRDVFALSRFRHMTNADIATRLGLSIKTVEWRIGKALEFCASRLRN